MVEVPDSVLEELAGPVAASMPLVASRVPRPPAAVLGRLRADADGAWPLRGPSLHIPNTWRSDGDPGTGAGRVRDALGALPPLLVERLLGALELTVAELDPDGVPDLTEHLGRPVTGSVATATVAGTSEAVTAAAMLDRVRPEAVTLVAEAARGLAAHPRVSALLTVDPEPGGEAAVAAAHGAAHLALAVSTAVAVLNRAGLPPWLVAPPAVVGVALGTAVLLLREAPMPPGYAAARLARARAEYILPLGAAGRAPVSGHRFALLEDGPVPDVDFSGNGLVAVVAGGAVIRTGIETGEVHLVVDVLDGPPPDVADGWEEIVEVSWRAFAGGASVAGAREPHLSRLTPPWPGDYRLRVHARGRDVPDGTESYRLMVWEAPAAAEVVHARADRLGHRLRGEPEPPEPPEAAYRWLAGTALAEAATVTVVTGADVAEVLRAFGADPDRPESLDALAEEALHSLAPWVAVLDVGGAVLAVEYNGHQGSREPVLARASTGGRAASMYWNVDALTRLSFAEHGEILFATEPLGGFDVPARLAPVLDGLDFADHHRRVSHMGMAAVERFTGHRVTADDLAAIESADVAYRIAPDPPPAP